MKQLSNANVVSFGWQIVQMQFFARQCPNFMWDTLHKRAFNEKTQSYKWTYYIQTLWNGNLNCKSLEFRSHTHTPKPENVGFLMIYIQFSNCKGIHFFEPIKGIASINFAERVHLGNHRIVW